ncbi:hypothetical protein PsYK624_051740 [Phanerochaete sordida]|uniref:Thioredoxin-like protein n=1 Tax=Phanerochaete sordida TaxID=48140 RepID=A0A9P3LCP9_9APHY|nr:hypothetical protein PsYK624_051740 [Phanerochaete sordida]
MFSAFKLTKPQISIFHSPASPASVQALKLLNAAASSAYPPSKPSAPPLSFNLEVVENQPPTADQLRTILSYLPGVSSLDSFVSAHYAVDSKPSDPTQLAKLASKEPRALKWPIVVNWEGGKAAVGDVDGVKRILEDLRKQRDGESKGDN